MKSSFIVFTALLGAALLFINCTNDPAPDPANKWYEETKAEILKQADHKPDSVVTVKNNAAKRETLTDGSIIVPETTLVFENAYSGGRLFHRRTIKHGKLRGETHFSADGSFELSKEIFENGNLLFEGIAYNGHSYGLSTWNHPNGKLAKQGLRFNDQRIGTWKKWDVTGKLLEETDYKNLDKLDALPQLLKQGHAQ